MSRRRCITSIALLLATLAFGTHAEAQIAADEAEVKAAFVFNFLKFVEWPADAFRDSADRIVVAIIGKSASAEATERFLASKQIGNRAVAIRPMHWDDSLDGVHALFVAEHDARRLRSVLNAAAAAGVLTIGDGEAFATQGGVIGLLVENRRVRFDIDADAARTARLRVSSKLLALARVVYPTTTAAGARP